MPKIKSKSAWMRDWINRIDGKTTYTTDGTIVYCQPCQQQVENQPFSSRQQQQQDNENNLQEIGMVLRGEHVQMHLPPDVIAKFKYAPIQSCEVERSFSIYKHILADNRMSFTTENLEKFLICNCKNNC
uniref:Transposase n=1 Tax=Globodera rostochiensis TaxID=31243 RepID=A0A914HPI9_GLORO